MVNERLKLNEEQMDVSCYLCNVYIINCDLVCYYRLPDGLSQLGNLTQLGLNDVALTRLPYDIARSVKPCDCQDSVPSESKSFKCHLFFMSLSFLKILILSIYRLHWFISRTYDTREFNTHPNHSIMILCETQCVSH